MASAFHFGLLLLVSGQLLLTATAAPTKSPEVAKGVKFALKQGNCTSGWVQFLGCCFKLSQVPETWKNAMDRCNSEGANLVSSNNVDHFIFLRFAVFLVDQTINSVWTGGVFVSGERAWRWSDGSLVPQTVLKRVDHQSKGSCMDLKIKVKPFFSGVECDKSLPYICSKKV